MTMQCMSNDPNRFLCMAILWTLRVLYEKKMTMAGIRARMDTL